MKKILLIYTGNYYYDIGIGTSETTLKNLIQLMEKCVHKKRSEWQKYPLIPKEMHIFS